MVNLAEVLALRPDWGTARKVLYMHENQLAYPAQWPGAAPVGSAAAPAAADAGAGAGAGAAAAPPGAPPPYDRDFQFGWAQVLSCLVADVVAWNSSWNLESFLAAVPRLLRLMPDRAQRPDAAAVARRVRDRSVVVPLPVDPPAALFPPPPAGRRLRIAWNHRWEYDKRPAAFFLALRELADAGADFDVVVLGEAFAEAPPEFEAARAWLEPAGRVAHWGFAPDRRAYVDLLASADVAVSTAAHEFFGVATLEAAAAGVFPLAPAALAYPEALAPTPAEVADRDGALGRIRALVAAPAPPAFPLEAAAAGGGGGGGGGGAGSGGEGQGSGRATASSYPPPRPSPHLYSTPAQLRRALLQFARDPARVRAWRARMAPVLAAAAGDEDSGTADGAVADAVGSAVKRARLSEAGAGGGPAGDGSGDGSGGGSGALPVPSEWAFSTRRLAPLYRALLLHEG
jgi:hypothetical protein